MGEKWGIFGRVLRRLGQQCGHVFPHTFLKREVICEYKMKNTSDPKISPVVVYGKMEYEDMDQ